MMKSAWPAIPIGELLERVVRPVEVDESQLYREIGIRSHGKGVFHKPAVTGKELGDKRVFWVEPGCLVFNIIFAWEQAVAITSESESGMIASHRFPMYRTSSGKLLPEYARLYFVSPQGKHDLNIASPGGAGRNKTLGQREFSRLRIPVPPIDHQRLAVDATAAWDLAIDCTRNLLEAKRTLKTEIGQQLLLGACRLSGFQKPWTKVVMTDVAAVNPGSPKPGLDDDVTFLAMADIAEGGGVLNKQVRRFREVATGFTSFQDGDILVAKITPCFENGKGALLSDLTNGVGFGTTELHVVRAKPGISPDFLYHVTMSKPFRQRGVANMTGSAGQKRIPTAFVRHYYFECPPFDEQKAIAAVLSTADLEVNLLERKLACLEKQKKALLQHLLLGNARNHNSTKNGGKP